MIRNVVSGRPICSTTESQPQGDHNWRLSHHSGMMPCNYADFDVHSARLASEIQSRGENYRQRDSRNDLRWVLWRCDVSCASK
jgi:hypothetical protein